MKKKGAEEIAQVIYTCSLPAGSSEKLMWAMENFEKLIWAMEFRENLWLKLVWAMENFGKLIWAIEFKENLVKLVWAMKMRIIVKSWMISEQSVCNTWRRMVFFFFV